MDETFCLTGKNKNGSCRSLSRGSGRVARATYRHGNVSVGMCLIVCGNLGFQHGNVYGSYGAWGISTPGATGKAASASDPVASTSETSTAVASSGTDVRLHPRPTACGSASGLAPSRASIFSGV
jgi:hypothetical protein